MKNLRNLRVGLVVAIILLSAASVRSANAVFPKDFLGVALGSADIDEAASLLESKGWVPDVDAGDEADDKKLYLFIFGEDKPIRYWNVSWGSAMYVTTDARPHVIEDVFLMTSLTTRKQALSIYRELAGMIRSDYKRYIVNDEDDNIRMRSDDRYVNVSLRESSSKKDSWFISLIIHGAADNTANTQSGGTSSKKQSSNSGSRPASKGNSTSSGTTYVSTSGTIPHSILGVEIGTTRINDAMKILQKKGYSPEIREKQERYITLKTSDTQLKVLGKDVMMVNIFFSEPKKQTCTDIYCAILFDNGSEAREFIQSARKDLTAKYGNSIIVDEQNKLVFSQDGYYMKVERSYLQDSDAWIAWVVFSNSPLK